MAAKIFAIANQKGGVGKTTTAVNLAAGLARRRIRTVLVDMDQQASATSALGYEKSLGGSLYQVLHGEGSARDKLIQTQRQNLWLIPSETDMSAIEVELSGEENYLVRLRDCLKPLKESGDFDAIVIDAPPRTTCLSPCSANTWQWRAWGKLWGLSNSCATRASATPSKSGALS